MKTLLGAIGGPLLALLLFRPAVMLPFLVLGALVVLVGPMLDRFPKE
jgi:hypothetical protein